MRKFYDLLESGSSGVYDISIAIRGFGCFAPAIKQFMGSWELKRLLAKLFAFQETVFTV
jgi:hypothetical protein